MKLKTIATIALAALTFIGFTGCSTTSGTSTLTPALVTLAVAEGSAVEMQSNPSTRPYFVAAATTLSALTTGTVTIAQIQSALTAAGGSNAASPAVVIGIQDGLALLTSQYGTNGVIDNVYLTAIVTGLDQAVAANTPAAVSQLKAAYKAARKQ